MKANAGFLSLAEELQFYIIRLLPYRDILRCTSVSRNPVVMSILSLSKIEFYSDNPLAGM